jgi:hypothetical protein
LFCEEGRGEEWKGGATMRRAKREEGGSEKERKKVPWFLVEREMRDKK